MAETTVTQPNLGYLQDVWAQAQAQNNKGTPGYYNGQTVAGFTQDQINAMNQQSGFLGAGGTAQNVGNQLIQQGQQNAAGLNQAQNMYNQMGQQAQNFTPQQVQAQQIQQQQAQAALAQSAQNKNNAYETARAELAKNQGNIANTAKSATSNAWRDLYENQLTGLRSGAADSGNVNSSRRQIGEAVATRSVAEQQANLQNQMSNDFFNNAVNQQMQLGEAQANRDQSTNQFNAGASQQNSQFNAGQGNQIGAQNAANALNASGQNANNQMQANGQKLEAMGNAASGLAGIGQQGQQSMTTGVGTVNNAQQGLFQNGQYQQGMNQAQLQANMDKWKYETQAPWDRLNQYNNLVSGNSGSVTTKTPDPSNASQWLGLGTSALGALGSTGFFGSGSGGWGSGWGSSVFNGIKGLFG